MRHQSARRGSAKSEIVSCSMSGSSPLRYPRVRATRRASRAASARCLICCRIIMLSVALSIVLQVY